MNSEENLPRFQRGSVTGYIYIDDLNNAYFDCISGRNAHYCMNLNNQDTYEIIDRDFPFDFVSKNNSFLIAKSEPIELIFLNNESFKEMWRTPLALLQQNEPLVSSFCVIDYYIFYTDHHFLYCLDSQTGNQLNKWNYIEKVQIFDIPEVNVRACMSVASNGSELVLTSSGLFGLIVVLDFDCNIIWVKPASRLGAVALAGDLLLHR
ncbi:MAG: PQQ-like beta-propeller repeat protein [Oleispira sp.]|nr:PQQ-like beta-propeller repeat protein [Oleispira sp.]